MDGIARSTIAALFYAQPDQIVFPDLVAELARSLLQNVDGGVLIHTDYDDFVMFDLEDRRICLAHSNLSIDFPEAAQAHGCAEAVIVSVGDRPDTPGGRGYRSLCEDLTDRIEAREPADGAVLAESDVAFTEEAFDLALEEILSAYWDEPVHAAKDDPAPDPEIDVENLFAAPAYASGAGIGATAYRGLGAIPAQAEAIALQDNRRKPAAGRERSGHHGRAAMFATIEPQALSGGLAARFDRELARRCDPDPRPVASASPPMDPRLSEDPDTAQPRDVRRHNPRAAAAFARLRQPVPQNRPTEAEHHLFPTTQEARAQPLVHRSAIHAVNLATMAFSLPVGAFLITLALLGRESLVMSSRTTAITGAGMGLAQNDTIASLVTSFFT